MKFKEGDRVRVLRWKDNDVNFHTTLAYANYPGFYHMSDSSDSYYNELTLLKEYSHYFGKKDYYILAEDEEDTEESEVQFSEEMWEEKVEPKIQKKVAKGKSILAIRGLFSLYSTEQLAEVGREFGYEVDVEQVILGTKLYIYW